MTYKNNIYIKHVLTTEKWWERCVYTLLTFNLKNLMEILKSLIERIIVRSQALHATIADLNATVATIAEKDMKISVLSEKITTLESESAKLADENKVLMDENNTLKAAVPAPLDTSALEEAVKTLEA